MSNEELLAAARTPGDKCEACFYIGERVRLEHTLAEAVPWYQQCIEQNERDYWEDRLARARLESAKSLDAGQQDAAHEN